MCSKLSDVAAFYAKDCELKKEDVESLSEWVKGQPHLPELEELQIILFLHSCYYDLEKAQNTLESYFKFRTTSQLCRDVSEESVRKTLKSFFLGPMPKQTPDGNIVFVMKMLNPSPEVYNCLEQSKVMIAIMVLYLHKFGPPNGVIVVNDVKGTSLGHLFKINLSVLKQTMHFLQETAPVRIQTLHQLNTFSIAQRIMTIAKPFMKKELFDKMKFYSHSFDGLYDYVPKDCLPEDYGGLLPPIEELTEKNTQDILDNWEILKWHETQLIDESKRVKKERGFFGSFFFGSS